MRWKTLAGLGGLAAVLVGIAYAQGGTGQPIPTRVNYQGRLAKPDGTVVEDGTYTLTFRLFTQPTGGTKLWEETYTNSVVVRNGVFSVMLGSTVPIRESMFATPPYLEIQIGANSPLVPRQPIASVPFALRAETARSALSVADGSITTQKLANWAVTAGKMANDSVVASKLANDTGSLSKMTGGAASTFPTLVKLTRDTYIDNHAQGGLPLVDLAVGDSDTGLKWQGDGLLDIFANGQPIMDIRPSHVEVRQTANFRGQVNVDGLLMLDPSSGPNGANLYSALRMHLQAGERIYLNPHGGGEVFVGGGNATNNLVVTGNLTVNGAKNFKIDHPQDPENRYLVHSCIESPDMMNVYNGVVRLDRKGKATVELPGYFEALNKDFRYQLTCVGGYAPVYVSREVRKNTFEIAGGKPGLKVSWQVTGVRQDEYANDNRVVPEVEKPDSEKGTRIYPGTRK